MFNLFFHISKNVIKASIGLLVLFLLGTAALRMHEDRGVSSLQKNTSQKFNKFQESKEEGSLSPVVRLVRHGQFTCSGAVISDEYVVTAAHCVSDNRGVLIKDIEIQDEARAYSVPSTVVGLNHRLDYALISGNFRTFKKFKVDENHSMQRAVAGEPEKQSQQEPDLAQLILGAKRGSVFISCGYPMGSSKKFCTEFAAQGDYNFQVVGTGILYPGMSGGPVFDPETNTVVAVNSAVSGQYAIVSPLIGILACFDVD